MKNDNKKLCIIALFLAMMFSLTLTLIPTLSKFVSEKNAPYGDKSQLDYTINGMFEARNQAELFAAINNGYSYVRLSNEIENPLIVTQKVETLHSDLILDLNGVEIQRNGHEPILDIKEGVRLTVIDTSEEQTGGLYNPIGSVFDVEGGTLTVGAGNFESGPRYSEYYSYNEQVLNHLSSTERTIVEATAKDVNFIQKNQGETQVVEVTPQVIKAPIIKSYMTTLGTQKYTHGNLYFDQEITLGDITIKTDTYCYYYVYDETLIDYNFDPVSADWYYTYYVTKDGYEYKGATLSATDSLDDYRLVTIYGYENIIYDASVQTDIEEYYAAIQMEAGYLEVQNGSFFSYFGIEETACVNASGGNIEVGKAEFSSRIPNATNYVYGGVNKKEEDEEAFEVAYFDNFNWANNQNTGGAMARQGEGYCILNTGDATLEIGQGEFYSSNNNILCMSNGELHIGGGDFTKRTTITADKESIKSAAVYMTDGFLHVDNSYCTVIGDNTYGIYSTVSGKNKFLVHNNSFNLVGGDNQTGIYAENGTVTLGTVTDMNATADVPTEINIDGNNSIGIHVEGGGSVNAEDYEFTLAGDYSYGIYSTSGSISITGGKIELLSNVNCYGIYAYSDENDELAINTNNTYINVGYVDTANGQKDSKPKLEGSTVNASIGVFLATKNAQNAVNLNNTDVDCYEVAVTVLGGTLNFDGTGDIDTNKASAIAISGGNLNFNNGSNYTITSANTTTNSSSNTYSISVPIWDDTNTQTGMGTTIYRNTDGIYVSNGTLLALGTVNLTHTGLQNAQISESYSSASSLSNVVTQYDYATLVVNSYAVRVTGGNVILTKGNIVATVGGGIYCSKNKNATVSSTTGSLIMGVDKNGQYSEYAGEISVRTTGTSVGSYYNAVGAFISNEWISRQSVTGGHAVELDGGDITIYYGDYYAAFGNGVMANGSGTIQIYGGTFNGQMTRTWSLADNKLPSGPSAYYGLKVKGGATVKIYGGSFDGGNGGAFVTGIDVFTATRSGTRVSYFLGSSLGDISEENKAKVYIYAGRFENTIAKDGFNVYDHANVVFGAYTQAEFENVFGADANYQDYQNAIKINATGATLAVNMLTNNANNSKPSTIDIYYGTYQTTNGSLTSNIYLDSAGTIITAYNTLLVGSNNRSTPYTIASCSASNGSFVADTLRTPTFYAGS